MIGVDDWLPWRVADLKAVIKVCIVFLYALKNKKWLIFVTVFGENKSFKVIFCFLVLINIFYLKMLRSGRLPYMGACPEGTVRKGGVVS